MKRLIVFVFLCQVLLSGYAQQYQVSLIPDSLLRNADAVKRMEEMQIQFKAEDKVIVKRKYAITILNEQGSKHAQYQNSYSSLEGLSDISGNLYDAAGKKIKSVKRRDIADLSSSDGFSLMLDDRIKVHNFNHNQYPYTIEYEDQQQLKGSYFLPYWSPVDDERFSVEKSMFRVEFPAGYDMRYKELNLTDGAVSAEVSNNKTLQWTLTGKKAFVFEPFQPPFNELAPAVYLGASSFYFGGFNGNMKTWFDFGKFQIQLNKGKDELPDRIKADVKRIVTPLATTEEKVSGLYAYMQQNTRYISVQLGIGGWQPFEAKYVANNRYGDCKALSNYMVSLLKEAGIKAHYVIVNAGNNRMGLREDFPAPYFNHVICCVPNGKDSIWLECTSQTSPAGYMGSFTGSRNALLVGDDGGYVVSTPYYREADNKQIRLVKGTVDKDGNLQATVTTVFTGIQQEEAHSLIHDASNSDREKYLNTALGLPTYTILKHSYAESPGKIPVITETLELQAPSFASMTGKRLFIQPNLFNKSRTRLSSETVRKFPVVFSLGYTDEDSVVVAIPNGYTAESLPKPVSIQTDFAAYTIRYTVENNQIIMVRKHTRKKMRLDASAYKDVVSYYDQIIRADAGRVVLVKKEE